MLQNAYFLARIGADTAENEQHFAKLMANLTRFRLYRHRFLQKIIHLLAKIHFSHAFDLRLRHGDQISPDGRSKDTLNGDKTTQTTERGR